MPSISSIISKLRSQSDAEVADRDQKYRNLVFRAASDQNITTGEVEKTLKECGRSVEQLAADVAAEQQRLADLSLTTRRDELTEMSAKVNSDAQTALARYNRELVALQESHLATMAEIRERSQAISAELDKCTAAERRLLGDSAELAAVTRELASLQRRESEMRALFARRGHAADAGAKQRIEDEIQEARSQLLEQRTAIIEQLSTGSRN